MWNILFHILTFTLGTLFGVATMCILQAGKSYEEKIKELDNERKEK